MMQDFLSTSYQKWFRMYEASTDNRNGNGPRRVGAPKGAQRHLTHGLTVFKHEVKHRYRCGRAVIDRRSGIWRDALNVDANYAQDLDCSEYGSTCCARAVVSKPLSAWRDRQADKQGLQIPRR